LENCKQLRKGVWPSDLVISRKETIEEMPWLAKFERTEKIASLIEYQTKSNDSQSTLLQVLKGILEDKIGRNSGMSLIKPLDTWRAEARGSSARVVSASLQFPDGSHLPAAVKIMRMDQVQYALPLFQEEVTILSLLNDLPGISRMIECGFIKLDENAQFPLSATVTSPPAEGRVIRIGIDSVEYFQEQIEQMIESDWTPYLAIEQQKQEDNLINYCDAGIMQGQYHPLITLLQMSIQICDIMQEAHNRNIVYRDHKILHYYWQASNNGVYIIDWNVARYHPEGLSKNEIEMDIVQFGARGLHHILTGRTAPGALPLGPTRPEEIEHAAHSYKTQWTFDDQRLSLELRSILERVLAGEYSIITDLGNDLKKSVIQLG
jgi:serine/threonine protein kinase